MQSIQVALIGNPNTGKTSVFNQLTGLKQQVGNYPGITVEKKVGQCMLSETCSATVLDLPGTYSLNASSIDENVVIEVLLNKKDPNFPDVIAVITDVENLKRNLLLFTQIKDLELPTVLVINMVDRMNPKGISLDIPFLEAQLQTKIVLLSSRKGTGITELKSVLANYHTLSVMPCLNASSIDEAYFGQLRKAFPNQLLYKLWLVITQDVNFLNLERKELPNSFTKSHADLKRLQQKGITILVSTPYMDEASLCDRIALIQKGKIFDNRTGYTWYNVNMKNLLGDWYNKYDKFNICLVSVNQSYQAAQYTNNVLQYSSNYVVSVKMSGLQWLSSYDQVSKNNTDIQIVGVRNFNESNNVIGTNNITFLKGSQITNITINLHSLTGDTALVSNANSTFGHMVFLFSISPVKD